MTISKRLALGGLQVGGPRTIQAEARWRVANNVYQTSDDYMVPRFHNTGFFDPLSISPTTLALIGASRYRNLTFTLGLNAAKEVVAFWDEKEVPTAPIKPPFNYFGLLPGDGVQYLEKLGCIFYMMPRLGLFKFDQYNMFRAGVPLPYFHIFPGEIDNNGCYVRVMQHYRDLQGNVVNSPYAQPLNRVRIDTAGTSPTAFGLSKDYARYKTLDGGEPQPEDVIKLDYGYFSYFFRGSSVTAATVVGRTLVVDTGADHKVVVGAYIWVSSNNGIFEPFYRFNVTDLSTGVVYSNSNLAMKVVAVGATTVTLSFDDVICIDEDEVQRKRNITAVAPSIYLSGANYFVSFWTSDGPTNSYSLKNVFPSYYETNSSQSIRVNTQNPTVPANGVGGMRLNLAPVMGDFYDVTTVKQPFPWSLTFNEGENAKSFTTFADMAYIAYENEIFYSDVTLGGAFEMTNGLSFINVGEEENGTIQSICGNADFLVVSRQFKNFYLAGNVVTANYRVQELSQTSLGAYSNESTISVGDKVIMLNKQGVWAINSGGKCDETSYNIKGLFNNFSNTESYAEEEYFNLDQYPTYASQTLTDRWIRTRFDPNRNLLLFYIKGNGSGRALVLNMNNGEFYTWSGLTYGNGNVNNTKDITFINGEYYVIRNDETGMSLNKEFKTGPSRYLYAEEYPVRLESTWFTAGEPSLEKKINQYKVWGRVVGTVEMGYYLDWNTTKYIKTDTYVNATPTFSHKNRLAPANALAVSVVMNVECSVFEVEGTELEFQPFQMGMKK